MFMTIQHTLFRKMFPVSVPPLADRRPHQAGRKVFARNLGETKGRRIADSRKGGREKLRTQRSCRRLYKTIDYHFLAHPPRTTPIRQAGGQSRQNLHLWSAVEPRRFTVTRLAAALTTTIPQSSACDRLSPRLCTKCIVVRTLDRLEPERQPPAAKRPAHRTTCDARVATV